MLVSITSSGRRITGWKTFCAYDTHTVAVVLHRDSLHTWDPETIDNWTQTFPVLSTCDSCFQFCRTEEWGMAWKVGMKNLPNIITAMGNIVVVDPRHYWAARGPNLYCLGQPGSLSIIALDSQDRSGCSARQSDINPWCPFEAVSPTSASASKPEGACADCKGLFNPTAIRAEEDTRV